VLYIFNERLSSWLIAIKDKGGTHDKKQPNNCSNKFGNLHEKIQLDLWQREKGGSLRFLGPENACKRAF
jgi:hypothetical protein